MQGRKQQDTENENRIYAQEEEKKEKIKIIVIQMYIMILYLDGVGAPLSDLELLVDRWLTVLTPGGQGQPLRVPARARIPGRLATHRTPRGRAQGPCACLI